MRTIACFFLILLLGILSVCVQPAAAQSTVDQHWIDQLKKTPVNQMEAGLSSATFADWFADRVKPSETGYEVKECQDGSNPKASVNTQRFLCVLAFTKPPRPGWRRGIQLDFVVGVLLPSATGATDAKPVPCRFWLGWDGPSNPQMLRPTRVIRKLSYFEKRDHAPATRPNSG
jgi:hypothetical protein